MVLDRDSWRDRRDYVCCDNRDGDDKKVFDTKRGFL